MRYMSLNSASTFCSGPPCPHVILSPDFVLGSPPCITKPSSIYAVEERPVVKAAVDQIDKVVNVVWSSVGEELHLDCSLRGFNDSAICLMSSSCVQLALALLPLGAAPLEQ